MCLAIPGKIVEIYDSAGMRMCKIDFGGVLREACLQALPEAKVGDFTIIHAGFALNILSENEAEETLEALRELGEIEDAMDIGEKE
jgi:hydrogenase expression/formation protein HypC